MVLILIMLFSSHVAKGNDQEHEYEHEQEVWATSTAID